MPTQNKNLLIRFLGIQCCSYRPNEPFFQAPLPVALIMNLYLGCKFSDVIRVYAWVSGRQALKVFGKRVIPIHQVGGKQLPQVLAGDFSTLIDDIPQHRIEHKICDLFVRIPVDDFRFSGDLVKPAVIMEPQKPFNFFAMKDGAG